MPNNNRFIDILSSSTGLGAVENRSIDCIGKADCTGPIKKPIDCPGLAPWVVCSFVSCDPIKGNQIAATVGGFDPASKEESLIKSFSLGFTDGTGCKLEIRDRKGSDLSLFFEKLQKDIKDRNKSFEMKIRFGWTCTPGVGCESYDARPEPMKVSKCHTFTPLTLQINYSKGGFNYILEGKDKLQGVFQTRMDNVYPEGGGKMKLKDAIIQAWKDTPAGPIKVSFKRRVPGTLDMVDIEKPFVNSSRQEIVHNSWRCEGTNPLSSVAKWKAPYKTDRGYGLRPMWDNTASEPTLVYVESGCKSEEDDRCHHTYIVNGGKYSPVISFSPTMNWTPEAVAEAYGGGAGSTATGASLKRKASREDNDCIVVEAGEGVGERTAIPPNESVVENEGPENAQRSADEGMNAQSNANNFKENIEAELVIQGDPEMDNTLQWISKKISIVVVNPFHPVLKLEGSRGQIKNSEWLANPTCNPILTDKKWQINGVVHDMKEGSYTTTLKVTRLQA